MNSEYSGIRRVALIDAKRRAKKQGVTLEQLVDDMVARYKARHVKYRLKRNKRKAKLRREKFVPITAMVRTSTRTAIEAEAKRRGTDVSGVIRDALVNQIEGSPTVDLDLMYPAVPRRGASRKPARKAKAK